MRKYKLGNGLRGWFYGEFANDEVAWNVLSDRFAASFPSDTGRQVVLIPFDSYIHGTTPPTSTGLYKKYKRAKISRLSSL